MNELHELYGKSPAAEALPSIKAMQRFRQENPEAYAEMVARAVELRLSEPEEL
jgi:hypothetical protein